MRLQRWVTVVSLCALAGAGAWAQGGPGAGPGPGPGAGPGAGPGMMQGSGPGASAPRQGMGPRAAMGARSGADYTPGWAMMSAQERNEHHERMRAMQTYEECHTYMEQHREQMAERAKTQGRAALAQPRRDACAGLKR